MAEYATASAAYPVGNSSWKRLALLPLVLTSNGTTVSIDATRSAPGFTITTGSNGALTGTAPKAARGLILTQGFDATVANELLCTVVAYSPTAGTFTLQTHNAGAESILGSGDELWLLFSVEAG